MNTRTKLPATLATLLLLAVVWSRTKAAHSEELPPQHSRLQITTHGGSREFVIHVPAACDKSRPSPLVIMLHGFGGTALNAAKETGWSAKADEHAFIIAYPEATRRCHCPCGRNLLDRKAETRKCPFPVLHHWHRKLAEPHRRRLSETRFWRKGTGGAAKTGRSDLVSMSGPPHCTLPKNRSSTKIRMASTNACTDLADKRQRSC
jgi:hypothetical protein